MRKKKQYKPEPDCPNCGGTHYGQRFDNCPFTKEEGLEYKQQALLGDKGLTAKRRGYETHKRM